MTNDDIKKTLEQHLKLLSECLVEWQKTAMQGARDGVIVLCQLNTAYNATLEKWKDY